MNNNVYLLDLTLTLFLFNVSNTKKCRGKKNA